MITLLLFGFLIGMRHALDADHVAAVASLASRSRSLKDSIRQGASWGMGHTLSLLVVGGAVLTIDAVVPERVAAALELLVGVMLVVLGADVVRRIYRDGVHFHAHKHADGREHFHAHSHASDSVPHESAPHEHAHRFPVRALFVGIMHGMAGSAALVLLSLNQAPTVTSGILYILLFGIGSIVGMAVLSVAISIPLRYSAQSLGRLHRGLVLSLGVATVALGVSIIVQSSMTG